MLIKYLKQARSTTLEGSTMGTLVHFHRMNELNARPKAEPNITYAHDQLHDARAQSRNCTHTLACTPLGWMSQSMQLE